MIFLDFFFTFIIALFAALLAVPFLCKWALDQGALDEPDARKIHSEATPRLGGIAIFLSFLLSANIFIPFTPVLRGLMAGGLIIFVTGLIDDLSELSAKRKFAGEIGACLVTIIIGQFWLTNLGNLFGFGDIILPPWIGIPFTVFAVVGVINAINLIDGLDGLAGGLSVLMLTAFFVLGWLESDHQSMFLTAALAGGLLGFLKYNFYPARIFMGDAGSLTVGFLLGFIAVFITQKSDSTISPMAPILILALPIIDTIWVMTKRVMRKESPFTADRTHVHHRFLDFGLQHRLTVVTIYFLSLFWACSALTMRRLPEYLLLLYLIGTTVFFYTLLKILIKHRERFKLLKRDSRTSLRETMTYQRITALLDHMFPGLMVLISVYYFLALCSVVAHCAIPWQMPLILMIIGIYFWYRPFRENRQFVMLILYVIVGMATVEVWHWQDVLFADITIKHLGDIFLALGALIAIMKVLFRHPSEIFLTSADYLTLALCIFLIVALREIPTGLNFVGPLARSLVAILILRILSAHSRLYYKWVTLVTLLSAGLMGLSGFIASNL